MPCSNTRRRCAPHDQLLPESEAEVNRKFSTLLAMALILASSVFGGINIPSTTTLTSSPNPSIWGQAVHLPRDRNGNGCVARGSHDRRDSHGQCEVHDRDAVRGRAAGWDRRRDVH